MLILVKNVVFVGFFVLSVILSAGCGGATGSQATELSAVLSGDQEVPAVTTTASGSASVSINEAQTEIAFTLNVSDITDITAGHIHVGARGVDGPIILPLAEGPYGNSLTGTLTETDLTPQADEGIDTFADAVAAILDEDTYINVHTAANPGGEIRGQIEP